MDLGSSLAHIHIPSEPPTYADSLYANLEEGWKSNPNGVAVIVPFQDSTHLADLAGTSEDIEDAGCLTWSFKQLLNAAIKVALGFQDHGVRPGATVMTFLPMCVECPLLLLTSALLQFTWVPVDPGALAGPRSEELANLMSLLKPDAIVIENASDTGRVDEALGSLIPTLKQVLKLNATGSMSPGWTGLLDVAAQVPYDGERKAQLLQQARLPDLNRVAVIHFTSGTSSGRPKGCPRLVRGVLEGLTLTTKAGWFRPKAQFLLLTPFFRGISYLTLAAWAVGGACIMSAPRFDPTAALDALERFHASTMAGIPAIVKLMVSDPSFSRRDVSSLQTLRLGGDVITRDTFSLAQTAFPMAAVSVGHGMTEGAHCFYWPFHGHKIDDFPWYGEIAPLGKVIRGATVRVRDAENSHTIARGDLGELHYCTPSVIEHYVNHEQEDSFYDDADGRWFKTGDLGMINEDGIVYILGRVKDRIKRAGVPITPVAQETCIEKFIGAQTVVVGTPHPIFGHEPFAIVKDYGGKTEDQIKKQITDMFGPDYALGGVISLEELGLIEFPLNQTGKVMKFELVESIERYKQSVGTS